MVNNITLSGEMGCMDVLIHALYEVPTDTYNTQKAIETIQGLTPITDGVPTDVTITDGIWTLILSVPIHQYILKITNNVNDEIVLICVVIGVDSNNAYLIENNVGGINEYNYETVVNRVSELYTKYGIEPNIIDSLVSKVDTLNDIITPSNLIEGADSSYFYNSAYSTTNQPIRSFAAINEDIDSINNTLATLNPNQNDSEVVDTAISDLADLAAIVTDLGIKLSLYASKHEDILDIIQLEQQFLDVYALYMLSVPKNTTICIEYTQLTTMYDGCLDSITSTENDYIDKFTYLSAYQSLNAINILNNFTEPTEVTSVQYENITRLNDILKNLKVLYKYASLDQDINYLRNTLLNGSGVMMGVGEVVTLLDCEAYNPILEETVNDVIIDGVLCINYVTRYCLFPDDNCLYDTYASIPAGTKFILRHNSNQITDYPVKTTHYGDTVWTTKIDINSTHNNELPKFIDGGLYYTKSAYVPSVS